MTGCAFGFWELVAWAAFLAVQHHAARQRAELHGRELRLDRPELRHALARPRPQVDPVLRVYNRDQPHAVVLRLRPSREADLAGIDRCQGDGEGRG